MSTWLIIALLLYIAGIAGFIIAMSVEAPKHGTKLGLAHVVVAIVWPAWGAWYLSVLATEKIKGRK